MREECGLSLVVIEIHKLALCVRLGVTCVTYVTFFLFFLALTVIPGPPLFSLTIRLRNPFPGPVTFVTGQRLLKKSFPDSASRLCTVGSASYLRY